MSWWEELSVQDLKEAGWQVTEDGMTHPDFAMSTFSADAAKRVEALKAGELSTKEKQVKSTYENIGMRLDEVGNWLSRIETGLTAVRKTFNLLVGGSSHPKVKNMQNLFDALESELTGQVVGNYDGWDSPVT
jgi:hypothetical protein